MFLSSIWTLCLFLFVIRAASYRILQPITCIKHLRQKLLKNRAIESKLGLSRCDVYAEKLNGSKTRWGGPVIGPSVRYLATIVVGSLFAFFFRVLNSFRAFGRAAFLDKVFHRPKGRGLLSVSNHLSVLDDPGLWSALLPWWRMRPEQMRWSLCTEDVFFYNAFIAQLSGAGNVLPLDRGGSLEQPLFKIFQDKLNNGSWTHVFAEGRVWQAWRFEGEEQRLGPFKIGVGKLIAHSTNNPIVVPMYHKGLDQVAPEKPLKDRKSRKASKLASMVPRVGKKIELFIGDGVDFQAKLQAFDALHGPEMRRNWQATSELLQLYTDIAEDVRKEVLKLEEVAWGRGAASCASS